MHRGRCTRLCGASTLHTPTWRQGGLARRIPHFREPPSALEKRVARWRTVPPRMPKLWHCLTPWKSDPWSVPPPSPCPFLKIPHYHQRWLAKTLGFVSRFSPPTFEESPSIREGGRVRGKCGLFSPKQERVHPFSSNPSPVRANGCAVREGEVRELCMLSTRR